MGRRGGVARGFCMCGAAASSWRPHAARRRPSSQPPHVPRRRCLWLACMRRRSSLLQHARRGLLILDVTKISRPSRYQIHTPLASHWQMISPKSIPPSPITNSVPFRFIWLPWSATASSSTAARWSGGRQRGWSRLATGAGAASARARRRSAPTPRAARRGRKERSRARMLCSRRLPKLKYSPPLDRVWTPDRQPPVTP